jgi:hypothetical protein
VIPDGRQHIEYTPTQVLTEYLRWMPENRIDGIALPSAQTGEKTHVLFFDSKAFADADRDPPGRPASFPAVPAVNRAPALCRSLAVRGVCEPCRARWPGRQLSALTALPIPVVVAGIVVGAGNPHKVLNDLEEAMGWTRWTMRPR